MLTQPYRRNEGVIRYLVVLSLAVSLGCTGNNVNQAKSNHFTSEEVQRLATLKVFFGHKSVGENILDGVRDLQAENPRLNFRLVKSAHPASVRGPALIEAEIGENRDPESKDKAFAAALQEGLGGDGGIVLHKYCFVDIDQSTDVPQLFQTYRRGVDELRTQHPELKIVHVTVPLTTVEPTLKAWIKNLLGRSTERDAAVKRDQFNRLMRDTYQGSEPIFDIAEVESTAPDGSRTFFTHDNDKVYTLSPEYTTDGGHLNELGRRAAAERLLGVLSRIP